VSRCPGLDIRRQDAECRGVLVHGLDVALGQVAEGLVTLRRAGQDLVVDVSDIADIGDIEAGPFQVAVHDVEHHQHARMAQVAEVVDGHTAHVHAHLAGLDGRERLLAACQGIVDLEHWRLVGTADDCGDVSKSAWRRRNAANGGEASDGVLPMRGNT